MVHSSPTSWLVVLVVGLVALSGLQIYNGFVHRSPGSVVDRNRLCTTNDTKRPSYCDMSGRTGTPQFKKILWFVTDGLPVRYSTSLLNYFSDHSVTYVIDVPGAKYSHAIYTSWLTGQGTYTNYEGSDIHGDSLIERMAEAGMNLRYVGPEWSFLALLGSQNYQRLFKTIELHHEPLHEQSLHIYPFFFENMTSIDHFYNHLWPELERTNQSLITHSGIFDHFSHGVFRSGSNETLLNGYSLRAQEDLMALRSLVDNNPEYLLILSSDHGVDEITSHGYVLHGFTRDGNEGYLMLYNPMLEPSYERPIIDVTDVCATIAKYLENVDIPFNNIGITRSYFGPRGKLKQVKALKQNLHQLSQTAEWRGKLDARMKLDIQALLHERYTTGDEQLIHKLLTTATELKALMYDTMEAPTDRVFTSTAALSALLLVAFQVFFGIGNLFSVARHRPLLAIVYLAVFAFVLFAPLGHLLFMSTHWTRVFQQGTVFYLPSLSLAFVQIALLARIWSFDSLSRTRRSSPLSAVCYTAISMLVINESINWLLLALSLLFRSHWKSWFSSLTGSRELVYLLAMVLAYVQLWPSRRSGSRNADAAAHTTAAQSRTSFLVVLLVALLLLTYEWTVSINEAYLVFGFHVAFAAAFLIGLLGVLSHLFVHRSVQSVSAGFSLLLLVLWMDSNTGRLLHLTWSSQGLLLLYPVFELVRLASTMLHSPPESLRHAQAEHRESAPAPATTTTIAADDDGDNNNNNDGSATSPPAALASPNVELSLRIESRLLILATFIYIANSTFYHLAVNMGDRVSLDVHPFVGRVGVRSYDEYPTLAGFFMVWHKYGVFLSFVFGAVAAATPATVNNLFNLHQSRISPFCAHAMQLLEAVPKHVQMRWIANQPRAAESGTVVLIVTSIFYAAALTGHCWLLAVYSPELALEESVVYSLLWAALSGIMFVLILISRRLSTADASSITRLLEKEHAFD